MIKGAHSSNAIDRTSLILRPTNKYGRRAEAQGKKADRFWGYCPVCPSTSTTQRRLPTSSKPLQSHYLTRKQKLEMLDARETFEKYERRASPSQNFSQQRDYREQLACSYTAHPPQQHEPILACEYTRPGTTTTRTFVTESRGKRKIPIGAIIAVAIGVPILIVIVLFAAVWLQELGIL
ncbi:unnamed protein product [Caenorhabditis auriculariae]|uniref:Uncharacterized protein n=1 Tax=Caenorhabditis auriculariae TaxID=2777116 RepID=A0A8S1GNP3_9PELO|nr:unnamed protein product [Caenorhabditis auriculariae]